MFIHRVGIFLSLLVLSAVSQARDYGQYKYVPAEIKTWIESLRDAHGVQCCATADGYREVEWDMTGNSYRVKVENSWIVVPDRAVIKGPNRIGHRMKMKQGGQRAKAQLVLKRRRLVCYVYRNERNA